MIVAWGGNLGELLEDVPGLPSGGACGFLIAGGMMSVSEAAKYGGMVLVVTEFLVQGEGLLIAGDGVLVAAEVMVGAAQAVEGVDLAAVITEFPLSV